MEQALRDRIVAFLNALATEGGTYITTEAGALIVPDFDDDNAAPNGVAWGASLRGSSVPRVVLSVASGFPYYDFSGRNGIEEARVQADCYGANYAEAQAVYLRVDAALDGFSGGGVIACWRESVRSLEPDADEYLFRISTDWRVHYRRN